MSRPFLILVCTLLMSVHQAEADCVPNIPGDVSGDCRVNFTDFATTALDWLEVGTLEPNVVQEWVDRYNGPGNGDDYACAIAIDSNNNIYVTGESSGSGIASDFCTIKYAPDSNIPVWVARYDGPSNDSDYAKDIAIDSNDNVYVTGYGRDDVTFDDFVTIKYSPESNEPVWVARYDGPISDIDEGRAIAIDSKNNIYVTGYSIDPGGLTRDAVTIKYDPDGNELWIATYGSGNGHYYYTRAIAIDTQDNIYVTGQLKQDSSMDYFTIKYAADSNQEAWMVRYNSPGNGDDSAKAVAIDSNDNIYVTGSSTGLVLPGDDYATIKYDTNGNEIWIARYNGPGNYDSVYGIVIDGNDNIYVTGASCASDGPWNWDYATIKYTPDSNIPVWVARYNGPGNDEDIARAISLDKNGNIYVTGESIGSGTYYDYATVKYDPNGNQIWVARYEGPGTSRSNAEALALDSNDNVYVTGYSENGEKDYATIRYSQSYDCTPEIEGDANNDCKVDITDLAEIAKHWLDCNIDPPESCWE